MAAILLYLYLGRRFRRELALDFRIFRKPRNISPFRTVISFGNDHFTFSALWMESSTSLSTPFNTSITKPALGAQSLIYHYLESGYPRHFYDLLSSPRRKLHLYEHPLIYQFYRLILSIIAWAGILLLLTPVKYTSVFLPHFSTELDVVISLILSISIFESSISAVYFFVGVTLQKIMMVEAVIIAVFSLSLITPSMAWIFLFDFDSRVVIYVTVLLMILFIGWIISQLRTRDNLFRSSLFSGIAAYFFFIFVIVLNLFSNNLI
ncbi:MAG: hypothetical protein QW812_05765 [Thermoplasmataceae archaeon]